MKLTTKLSRILGDRRIKQLELARQSGLTKQTINAVYNDRWKHISRETIEKICTALDIDDISFFFELARDDEKEGNAK